MIPVLITSHEGKLTKILTAESLHVYLGCHLQICGNSVPGLVEEPSSQWLLVLVECLPKHVNNQLVGSHHDGGVGDLPDQLRAQPPVQPPPPLLPVDHPQCLPERLVFASWFSQSCSRYFCNKADRNKNPVIKL